MLTAEAVHEETTQFADHGIFTHGYAAFGHTLGVLPRHARILRSDTVIISHRMDS
jgi:hypothetical protein